jgi:biopolymer transport protein ExbB
MFDFPSTSIVTATLWVLKGFSVLTWTVVFAKLWQQWRIGSQNSYYSRAYWSASDLASAAELPTEGPLGRLAHAGFVALKDADDHKLRDLLHSASRQDLLERCLRQQLQKERSMMESGLAFLASVGSTAPFVGLFGTVWGIKNALQDISKAASASLEVVAGPIGEALIATAAGIAVAIPAVLAYNYFVRRVKLRSAELENFATDFLHVAIMNGLTLSKTPTP